MKKRILAIDPSVMNSAGWATVDFELAEDGKTILSEDWNWGAWELNGMNFKMRCEDLRDYILMQIKDFDEAIFEWPMFYSSAKGQTAAREGHTINLAGIAMYLVGWFQLVAMQYFLYTAPSWKGQQTKAATGKQFFKLFGLAYADQDHNAVDAVMMLVHHCQKEGYK